MKLLKFRLGILQLLTIKLPNICYSKYIFYLYFNNNIIIIFREDMPHYK